MEHETELMTDAQLSAQTELHEQPPWMVMLQHIVDVQTDTVMKALGVNTRRLLALEANVTKAQAQIDKRFNHIETKLQNSEAETRTQITTIE